jgi:transposase-like protein
MKNRIRYQDITPKQKQRILKDWFVTGDSYDRLAQRHSVTVSVIVKVTSESLIITK